MKTLIFLVSYGVLFALFAIHRGERSSGAHVSHRCQYLEIPYITQPLETAFYLLHSNVSFIRFGDSEVLLIRGGSEPFQRYTTDLADQLFQAFVDSDARIAIGLYDTFSGTPLWNAGSAEWWEKTQKPYRDWVCQHADMTKQYYSAMITSTYVHTYGTHCALLPHLYDTLRKIWSGKDIVVVRGDNNQTFDYDIYDTARSQKVVFVPRSQAWNVYSEVKQLLLQEPRHSLFILTAGPISRVLAYELTKQNRRALDLGHLAKDYDYYRKQLEPVGPTFFERDQKYDL